MPPSRVTVEIDPENQAADKHHAARPEGHLKRGEDTVKQPVGVVHHIGNYAVEEIKHFEAPPR